MSDTRGNNELGAFLTLLRSKQKPEDHDVTSSTRRRVPGLRREEVAHLIGVSVEYYARLERGVAKTPSTAVIDSLARTFGLTSIEREHLDDLTRSTRRPTGPGACTVRPELAGLLTTMPGPAFVMNHRFDVLASNHLARVVFFDFELHHDSNLARFLFTDPTSMRRYVDWTDVARATVGQLRVAAARHCGDRRLLSLINDLRAQGNHFARMWGEGNVAARSYGVKRLWLEEVGHLDLRFDNLELAEDRTLRLVLLHADPASTAADRLRLLTSLTADADSPAVAVVR